MKKMAKNCFLLNVLMEARKVGKDPHFLKKIINIVKQNEKKPSVFSLKFYALPTGFIDWRDSKRRKTSHFF